jgi:hypothetical protein
MASFANVRENRIDVAGAHRISRFAHKAAKENAIDSILAHPFAMKQRWPFPEGAVEPLRLGAY